MMSSAGPAPCPHCAALREELEQAKARNRLAAGILGDLEMLSARARVAVDALLGDPPRESATVDDDEGSRGDVHVFSDHGHRTIAEMQACPSPTCRNAQWLIAATRADEPQPEGQPPR